MKQISFLDYPGSTIWRILCRQQSHPRYAKYVPDCVKLFKAIKSYGNSQILWSELTVPMKGKSDPHRYFKVSDLGVKLSRLGLKND